MVEIEDHVYRAGIQAHALGRPRTVIHGAGKKVDELVGRVGTTQSLRVRHDGADALHLSDALSRLRHSGLVLVLVQNNELLVTREHSFDGDGRLVAAVGMVRSRHHALHAKRHNDQDHEHCKHGGAMARAERRQRLAGRPRGFLCSLADKPVGPNAQGRHDAQTAHETQEHAFRQDNAQVTADGKAHEDKREQADNSGKRA